MDSVAHPHGPPSSDRTFAPHATLPEELTGSNQWICWKYGQKKHNGKRDKLPCHPVTTEKLAGWQKPEQWQSFDDAVQFYNANPGLAGIGIVLTPELGIVGIDMDYAIEVDTGEVHDWAIEHVRDFDTYTEVSPSGAGFRLFVIGTLPSGPNKVGNREIYGNGRWLTITGNVFNEGPIAGDRAEAIGRYRSKMEESRPQASAGVSANDPGLILDGNRNSTLTSLAGAMRRKGMSAEEIVPSLLKVNDDRCQPPLAQADVHVIAKSVARYEAANSAFSAAKSDTPTGRRVLRFRRADELIANPRPLAWLIRGILERDSLAMVFGDPGAGKSFLALDMAASIATGTEWHGHRVTQGPVFYIAGEGGNGIGRRLQAWELTRAINLGGSNLFVSTMPVPMTDENEFDMAVTVVVEMIREYGVPSMIVIDTVARNFGPGDENSTKDMTAFVAACDRLRDTGACILLVHHSGHGDKTRARGSIALKGALDWEYGIAAMSGAVHLTCTKAKDAEPPKPMAFRLTTVDLGIVDEDGEPVTSAVLTPALYMAPAKQGKAGRGKNQTIAMRVLKEGIKQCEDQFERNGQNPDMAWMSVTGWRDRCATDGLDPKRFAEVKNNLIKQGSVRVDDDRVTVQDREFAVI